MPKSTQFSDADNKEAVQAVGSERCSRLYLADCCNWCDGKLKPFDGKSEHEIIIRRYVGQHGHLIDMAFHPECWDYRRHNYYKPPIFDCKLITPF
jgi:hypothetical protein